MLRRAFPGGLTAIFVILFAELFVYTFDLTLDELSTICVILMAVNGLMVIYYAARPLDAKRIVMLAAIRETAGVRPVLLVTHDTADAEGAPVVRL